LELRSELRSDALPVTTFDFSGIQTHDRFVQIMYSNHNCSSFQQVKLKNHPEAMYTVTWSNNGLVLIAIQTAHLHNFVFVIFLHPNQQKKAVSRCRCNFNHKFPID